MSEELVNCGSLMFPKLLPLRRRSEEEPRRFIPMKQIEAIVRRIPRTRPGKNPTRMAPTGNLLHDWVGRVVALFPVFGETVEDEVGTIETDEEVAVGVAPGATSCLAFCIQTVPLQVYPKGQQALLQV